ncbi:MAG: MoxR family ATPase [Bacteroidia bacterium]|nr:MoxR family ATPase [Bacteroidia bacterium]
MDLFSGINSKIQLPSTLDFMDPGSYIMNPDLVAAVNIALASGQPLLLTGEPGTGKTQLAYKLAYELHQENSAFLEFPLIFNTKTSSVSRELFYTYDALGHFQASNMKSSEQPAPVKAIDHIKLQALGKAIALSSPNETRDTPFYDGPHPQNSVVLIDEIDKAPRDFPNDILHEIDQQEFILAEADHFSIRKNPMSRIVVIMTSNSEKNLPDAFLRRCIFYHIEFPSKKELMQIIQMKVGKHSIYEQEQLVDHFLDIRREIKKKKPATAELITWIKILELGNFLNERIDFHNLSEQQKNTLRMSYSVIAKNKEDLQLIKKIFL